MMNTAMMNEKKEGAPFGLSFHSSRKFIIHYFLCDFSYSVNKSSMNSARRS
jgi:hypothetical protein